ncbi:AAA family ATPase [Candidatus Woesearchaeota archaeon]|nr:AAA family ATPase [Candidatus Woesearchaeota archaeon]
MIIGITGPISSGKGKAAEFFKEKGFKHHSFSSEIRQVAKERGVEINRANLQKLGGELLDEKPDRSVLGERVLVNIKKEMVRGEKNFVVEGIRDVEAVSLFRQHEMDRPEMRFVLVGMDASQEERFKRMKSRGRKGEPETFEDFKRVDDFENRGGEGQEVWQCMKMADYTIQNDSGLEELREKVEKIIGEIV